MIVVNLLESMKRFEKYTRIIHHDFPYLNVSSIKKIGEGDNSIAFLINENYIFRFAKREEVKQQIRREILVLPKIKSAVTLQIPEFEFISPGIKFVGYKKIEGKVFTSKILQSLNLEEQIFIQKTLANFLSQVHSFLLTELKNCGLETMNPYEEYSENFVDAKEYIFPKISKNKRKIISRLFTEYLSNENNFNYTPALVHNDFSKDHILFDAVNKEITGIIDFGDIAIGDPGYDFMYLQDEFGETFLHEILKYYQHPHQLISINKIYFFSLANKIQILLTSLKNKDDEGIKSGLKDLNKWFKKFALKK
jgi:aminoglycoside 2''-phosphotransferase